MRLVKEKVIGSEVYVDKDDLTIEDKIIFSRESSIRLFVPQNGRFGRKIYLSETFSLYFQYGGKQEILFLGISIMCFIKGFKRRH